MKYKIIKNGVDDYTLKYKDKEIKFKSKVGLVSELQEVNKKARLQMIKELAEQGMTVKDLIIETTKDGKTIMDHSNKDFLEEGYIQTMQGEIFLKVIEDALGVDYNQLIQEIGLTTEDEITKFSEEIGSAITGGTPRG
ncbi:MAG: hypothetical protein II006_03385 [Peptostreptococcaceae bacterium]|nr:hypothetical protein [Peptostreptococcaceae bacterium]